MAHSSPDANSRFNLIIVDASDDSTILEVTGSVLTNATPMHVAVVDGDGTQITTFPVSNAGLTELAAAINASSQVDVNIAASGATVPVSNTGLTALNGAISGTEVQVDVLTIPALIAGTAAIGKLLPSDIDVTTHTNYAKKYYTNAGAVTDGIVWSPAAGKRWHVVTLYVQTSADATVTFEDDLGAGDSPVLKGEFKAGSGVTIPWDKDYPLASGEDAADLLITTSAGNCYVTCVGYEI